MSLLTNVADYYTTYSVHTVSNGTSVGAAFAILLIIFFIAAIAYVVMAFVLSAIFKKVGIKPWIAWVPVYNQWKLYQLGGQWGGWAVLAVIPYVNFVALIFLYIAQYRIGKGFGKGDAFLLWAIFVPIVWYVWLAIDDSTWHPIEPATATGITREKSKTR